MHEVSIMEGVLDTAHRLAREGNARQIKRIALTIGTLSGVVPDSLEFAFQALTQEGMAHGATLEITLIEALCHCESCRRNFTFSDNGYLCPSCGEPSMTLLQGKELELSTIEWI